MNNHLEQYMRKRISECGGPKPHIGRFCGVTYRQRRDKIIDPAGNIIQYDYEDTVSSECTTCASGAAVDKPSTIIYPTYTKH